MKNTLVIADILKPGWPEYIPYCMPMILSHASTGEKIICIKGSNNSCILIKNFEITHSDDLNKLKKLYEFVRYMTPEDSVTITGG